MRSRSRSRARSPGRNRSKLNSKSWPTSEAESNRQKAVPNKQREELNRLKSKPTTTEELPTS